jgi:PTH1 family peptidyl-tRNA hydrolase
MSNWLIVGLGNPGGEYEKTRHNLGFMLVDLLAEQAKVTIKREECRSLIGRAEIEDQKVDLAKPQTFMNLSGEAVKCLLAKGERVIEKLIVVSDELAIPFGAIRIRPKGTHAGHNGLRSIIDALGTQEFIRLRIGIGLDHPIENGRNFVLSSFSMTEFETVKKMLDKSAAAVRTIIVDGVEKAMARFN